jgi:tRNA(Ile)-lysidine synthase TilS/MesJ
MADGNKHLGYKEALNAIEATSPGTKHDFYFGFLARASDRFVPDAEAEQEHLGSCERCGAPTTGAICAFCKLVERAGGRSVPVELGRKA